MRVDETIALAALMQALVSKLHKLLKPNLTWRNYRRRLLDENRWRASRYGLDGKLIDFGPRSGRWRREAWINEIPDLVGSEVDQLEAGMKWPTSKNSARRHRRRSPARRVGENESRHESRGRSHVRETYEQLRLEEPPASAFKRNVRVIVSAEGSPPIPGDCPPISTVKGDGILRVPPSV